MKIVRIRQRGQITLPKTVRKQVGLAEDASVKIVVKAGRLILEPVEIASYPTRNYTQAQIRQFIKTDKLSPKLAKKVRQLFGR